MPKTEYVQIGMFQNKNMFNKNTTKMESIGVELTPTRVHLLQLGFYLDALHFVQMKIKKMEREQLKINISQ